MSRETENKSYSSRLHILFVDDDARIRNLVTKYLSEEGFLVMRAANAKIARDLLKQYEFDGLVVDIMMPGEDGLSFTKFVQAEYNLPVLLLTALGEVDDRLAGFEAGADDYLPKPFEPRELVMRLQSILRRTKADKDEVKSIYIGPWRFDEELEMLYQDNGEQIHLTAAESNLLKSLAEKQGEAVSREELAQKCGVDAGERTIDVQVTRLRRKIEDDSKNPVYLQTIRGKGYRLRLF